MAELVFIPASPMTSTGAAVLTWGNNGVAGTTTTRFLSPWYDEDTAQTVVISWRIPRAGTIRNMRVRHNILAGNGNAIVYTLLVNGVATALSVSLASTAADGSDLVDAIAVVAGDLVAVRVTKAASTVQSPTDIVASMEFV